MRSISKRTINTKIRHCFSQYTEEDDPTLIADALDKLFKPYGIRFIWIYDLAVAIDNMETHGYLSVVGPKTNLVIVIAFNENSQIFPLKEETLFDISTTIQHEMIHDRQYRSRGNRFYDKYVPMEFTEKQIWADFVAYFGTPDEIDAYAFNILAEIQFDSPDVTKVQLPGLLHKSITWSLYDQYFPKHKPKLMKKIYKLFDQGVHWEK